MARIDIMRRSDGRRTTRSRSSTCANFRGYNGPDQTAREASGPSDRDPRGEIEVFLDRISSDASRPSISDLTIMIFFETVHQTHFILTVDRFDRTVTRKKPIK